MEPAGDGPEKVEWPNEALLDHFIGEGEQAWGEREAKLARGLALRANSVPQQLQSVSRNRSQIPKRRRML